MVENAEDDQRYPSPAITSLDEEKLNQLPSSALDKKVPKDRPCNGHLPLEVHFVTGVLYEIFPDEIVLKNSPDDFGGTQTKISQRNGKAGISIHSGIF